MKYINNIKDASTSQKGNCASPTIREKVSALPKASNNFPVILIILIIPIFPI